MHNFFLDVGTPLPGLNMVVSDDDVGDNARFTLTLQSEDERVHRWFRVEPTSGQGRTSVVIRVNDNTDLDYDAGLRSARLAIIASIQDADVRKYSFIN